MSAGICLFLQCPGQGALSLKSDKSPVIYAITTLNSKRDNERGFMILLKLVVSCWQPMVVAIVFFKSADR